MRSVSFNGEVYASILFDITFQNPTNVISFEIPVKFICCFFVNKPQRLNRDELVRVDDSNDLAKTGVEPCKTLFVRVFAVCWLHDSTATRVIQKCSLNSTNSRNYSSDWSSTQKCP